MFPSNSNCILPKNEKVLIFNKMENDKDRSDKTLLEKKNKKVLFPNSTNGIGHEMFDTKDEKVKKLVKSALADEIEVENWNLPLQ